MNKLCVDKIAFSIAGYDIYWYGLIICCAILVAILVACLYSKKRGYDSEMPLNIALAVVPTGVLGARLFSVLFEESLDWPDFFNFRTGGLSIIGGIICGAIGLLFYCLVIKRDKDIFKYFDVLAVVLILAQAIGRWGNYFNQEVYGQLINSESFLIKSLKNLSISFLISVGPPTESFSVSFIPRFPFAVEVNGEHYMALFLYESCLDLVGFFILSNVYFGQSGNGYATSLYLVYYGLIRTILEPLRNAEYILMWNGLQISRLVSFSMIFVGIILYIIISVRLTRPKKGSIYGKESK